MFSERAKNQKKGFTLIEMVVVLGITIMLMGAMSVYKGIGTDQIKLFTEGAKVMQIILQAKSFAISSWLVKGQTVCGYGFRKTSATNFAVVRYAVESDSCPNMDDSAMGSFSSFNFKDPPEIISSSNLSQGLSF